MRRKKDEKEISFSNAMHGHGIQYFASGSLLREGYQE
jgi:hypothetical protein